MAIEGFREKYLERLGLEPSMDLPLTANTLAAIQEAHVRNVPFEIIDSMLGVHIDLRPEALFDKVVTRRRGGFCYEVNGLLSLFLEEVGFPVQRLAGWVPSCRDKFDHIFMRVEAEGEPWLVDVGFRNGSLLPLRFEVGLEQDGIKADYRIDEAATDEAWTEGFGERSFWLMRKPKGTDEWLKAYRFDLTPYEFEDYFERCYDFALGGWSPFQKRPSSSLETRNGEIYLNDSVFADVIDGALVERDVAGPQDFAQTLLRSFGVLTDDGDHLRFVVADDDLYDVQDVVTLEHRIEAEGTSLRELMERAGAATASAAAGIMDIQRVKPWDELPAPHAVILAGSGNNGGDGWVAARLLAEEGYAVTLVTPCVAEDVTAQPAAQAATELGEGVTVLVAPEPDQLQGLLKDADVIVDAMLGTGFDVAQVREPYATWIRLANQAHEAYVPVLAVDVPSGLSAQTGRPADACIQADATVTMLKVKRGLIGAEPASFVGKLFLAELI